MHYFRDSMRLDSLSLAWLSARYICFSARGRRWVMDVGLVAFETFLLRPQ